MIRLVFFALVALAAWVLLSQVVRRLKGADIDWTGVATIIGFIVMAFWLRHVTGMG